MAERPLAQHCPELLAQDEAAGPAADPLAALASFGAALARDIGPALASFLGGDHVVFTVTPPVQGDLAVLRERVGPLAANSLLAIGTDGARLLLSIDAETVFGAVDRAFGGKGEVPSPLPQAFAPSSAMMARRLNERIAATLASALELDPAEVQPLRSQGCLTALDPFAADAPLAVLSLRAERAGQAPCTILLALPLPAVAAGFGGTSPKSQSPSAADPREEPWCDVPLTVSAVLVDMRLPMSALAGLRPDALLPVAVARQVPLRVSDRTIAHGTIGSLEDRVAIQITQAF